MTVMTAFSSRGRVVSLGASSIDSSLNLPILKKSFHKKLKFLFLTILRMRSLGLSSPVIVINTSQLFCERRKVRETFLNFYLGHGLKLFNTFNAQGSSTKQK